MNVRNRAVVAGLTAALTLSLATPVAYATPQSELAQAAQTLESYGEELASLQESLATKTSQLEDTAYQIGKKKADITKTLADLAAAKEVLRNRMRSTYKSGSTSLLGVVMGADSIEEVISRVYYIDKIASSDAQAINEVRTLEERLESEKDDLEKTKTKQQKAVDELQAQVDDYEAKVAEASAYYDALDAQIQQQIAQQQEAEENARIQTVVAATEEAKTIKEAAQRADQQGANTEKTQAKQQDTKTKQEQQSKDSGESSTPQSPSVPSGGGLGSAYAAIGSPYSYGSAGPSSFDCSGLVCYCYGYGRGRTTYDMIDSLKSTGSWKTSMSQLAVGDLVFTNYGHVGIYTGNGMMIHAPTPGRTVCETSVYAFIGGGTY